MMIVSVNLFEENLHKIVYETWIVLWGQYWPPPTVLFVFVTGSFLLILKPSKTTGGRFSVVSDGRHVVTTCSSEGFSLGPQQQLIVTVTDSHGNW